MAHGIDPTNAALATPNAARSVTWHEEGNVEAERVFLCHASEDKSDVARPLAHALKNLGLDVWYDEFTLSIGDSLRECIDAGLRTCKYGVVILSPDFFHKRWAQAELNGLISREAATSRKLILPVWHNVDYQDVLRWSPMLADRIAGKTVHGIERLAADIANVIRSVTTPSNMVPSRQNSRLALVGRSYRGTKQPNSDGSCGCPRDHGDYVGSDSGIIYCTRCGGVHHYAGGAWFYDPEPIEPGTETWP